jgi:hypothetical protein
MSKFIEFVFVLLSPILSVGLEYWLSEERTEGYIQAFWSHCRFLKSKKLMDTCLLHVWVIQGNDCVLTSFDKAELNSQFREIYICNNLIRIRVSFICKLSGTPD